jgi:glutamine synthetase
MKSVLKTALSKTNYSKIPKSLQDIGTGVFSDSKIRNSVSPTVYEAFLKAKKTGKKLEKLYQNEIAEAMKDWALSQGCVTFTHWFSPLRGSNAEKHDSLIDLDSKGNITVDFSGSKLFQGETDGSRFVLYF